MDGDVNRRKARKLFLTDGLSPSAVDDRDLQAVFPALGGIEPPQLIQHNLRDAAAIEVVVQNANVHHAIQELSHHRDPLIVAVGRRSMKACVFSKYHGTRPRRYVVDLQHVERS